MADDVNKGSMYRSSWIRFRVKKVNQMMFQALIHLGIQAFIFVLKSMLSMYICVRNQVANNPLVKDSVSKDKT